MNLLGKAFDRIRAWIGLGDASESHLTPGHGWLLPAPADTRQERDLPDTRRAARHLDGKGAA